MRFALVKLAIARPVPLLAPHPERIQKGFNAESSMPAPRVLDFHGRSCDVSPTMKMLDVPQSGSIGGVTSSHNRAGQYQRSRRAPVSPTRTPKQSVARARFGASSALWQTLDAPTQNAWTAFAAAYPVVDSLGQSITLTGQQYFVGIQSQLQAVGQPTNTAVPTNTTLYPIDTPVLYADGSGTFIVSVAEVIAGDFNKVSCSPVLSNGVSFNKQFSQFAVLTSTTPILDISNVYAAQYGAPVGGKKIFVALVDVNSSGMNGNQQILQTPVLPAPAAAAPVVTNVVSGQLISTGPGVGTDFVAIFAETTTPGVFSQDMANSGEEVAGVLTVADLTVGVRYFTRTLIAGVYGKASNIITLT